MNDDETKATEAAAAPETSVTPSGNAVAVPATTERGGINKSLLMGTAVGIGSAAIVAALLYTKRKK